MVTVASRLLFYKNRRNCDWKHDITTEVKIIIVNSPAEFIFQKKVNRRQNITIVHYL